MDVLKLTRPRLEVFSIRDANAHVYRSVLASDDLTSLGFTKEQSQAVNKLAEAPNIKLFVSLSCRHSDLKSIPKLDKYTFLFYDIDDELHTVYISKDGSVTYPLDS